METAAAFSIMPWPNPSDGIELNINWRDGEPGATLHARLWTQAGASAFQGELVVDQNLNAKLSVDDKLSSGLYVLEIQTKDEVRHLKWVVK